VAEGSGLANNLLRDAVGVEHPQAPPDARIVSLVPSITELLFDLGLSDRVVGRTRYCLHPVDDIQAVPVVGGTKELDMAAFEAARPSHVIVNVDENRREMADAIASLGVRVVVTHPLTPRDNIALYRLLGEMFDARAAAERMVRNFTEALARLQAISSTLPPRKVLYLIWRKPWMTISRATYIAHTLALVNWSTDDPRDGTRYPTLPDPCSRLADSDLVLLSSEPFPFREKHVEELRTMCPSARAQFALIDAQMVSWYGSRAIPGLDYLLQFALEMQDWKGEWASKKAD